jgi:hypothetical protein
MKPNKIYIQEGAILRTEKTYDNDVCYIRKEALLEWLNKELDRLYELLPDASNDNPSQIELRHLGQYMQTEKLIDKLNEI